MNIQEISKKDFEEIRRLCLVRWPDFTNRVDDATLNFFLEKDLNYCLKYTEKDEILGLVLAAKRHSNLKIDIVIVDEKHRRKGIGTELIEHLERVCRKNGLKTIYLDSGERDYTTGAFNFYIEIGFKVTGFAHIHQEKIMFFEKEL